MKNFDIRRFCAVARWDLTINRAFYNKMAMVIAACSILPVLFYYAIENLEMVMVSDGVDKPYPSFLMALDIGNRRRTGAKFLTWFKVALPPSVQFLLRILAAHRQRRVVFF